MRLLDLYCCAGGAAKGYARVGYDVTGVDIQPRKHYPYPMIVGDALQYLTEHGNEYDVIHASPPCQGYSAVTRYKPSNAPLYIPVLRELLRSIGKPYIIENVVGAPLIHPVTLCGVYFGLRVLRHRLFESNVPIAQPPHIKHGDTSQYVRAHINFDSYRVAAPAMGIDWPMSRPELREAIPPAYTQYIGQEVRKYI